MCDKLPTLTEPNCLFIFEIQSKDQDTSMLKKSVK